MTSTAERDENKNMVAKFHGIIVEMVSPRDGPLLPLFPDPDAQKNWKEKSRSYYTEAKTDETFGFRVTYTPEFKMGNGDGLRTSLYVDGHWIQTLFLSEKEWAESHKTATDYFDFFDRYDPQTGLWKKAQLTFGSLILSSSLSSRYDSY